MADTSSTEPPKVDATSPAAAAATAVENKVDSPAETAQVEKGQGEVLDTTDDSTPAQATGPEEKVEPAIAESTEKSPATEPSTAAPVAVESKTEGVKPAESEKKKEAGPRAALDQFDAKLPEILKQIDHDEIWGVKLVTPVSTHIPTQIVLHKFLNANDGDLTKAIDQFRGALKFRKEKKPLDLVKKIFNANKFADLGAVTVYPIKDSTVPEVFTWNLYGNVKGKMEEVFVPLDEYATPGYM